MRLVLIVALIVGWGRLGCGWRHAPHRLKQKGLHSVQMSSSDDPQRAPSSPPSPTSPFKRRSENIDLFAAADRRTPVVRADITSSSSKPSTVLGSTNAQQSLQHTADQLRLEATREQRLIDLQRLEERRKLLITIDEALLPLYEGQVSIDTFLAQHKRLIRKEVFLRLAELINAETSQKERERLFALYDQLLQRLAALDTALHAEVTAEIEKDINAEMEKWRSRTSSLNPFFTSSRPNNTFPVALTESEQLYEQLLQQWLQQLQTGQTNSSSTLSPSANLTALSTMNVSGLAELMGGRLLRFPAALPVSLVPLILLANQELSQQDVAVLQSVVFRDLLAEYPDAQIEVSTYTWSVKLPARALVEKEPRLGDGNSVAAPYSARRVTEMWNTIQTKIDSVPGLKTRVRVFLLPQYMSNLDVDRGVPRQLQRQRQRQQEKLQRLKPEDPSSSTDSNRDSDRSSSGTDNDVDYLAESLTGNRFVPVFVAVSRLAAPPRSPSIWEVSACLLTFLFSVGTALLAAADFHGSNPHFVEEFVKGNDLTLVSLSLCAAGLLLPQLLHDYLGHFTVGSLIHKVKMSPLSFFLPSLQLGSFGSLGPRPVDFLPNRKVLFDIALAGPFVGFLASFLMIGLGIHLGQQASTEAVALFPQVPQFLMQSSWLVQQLVQTVLAPITAVDTSTGIAKTIAEGATAAAAATGIAVHPLTVAGLASLYATALQCLPIGRMDGGKIALALGGRQSAQTISLLALLVQAVSFLAFPENPILFFWSLYVIFLLRAPALPPEDDLTPVSSEQNPAASVVRGLALVFCALVTMATLCPALTQDIVTSGGLPSQLWNGPIV